MNIKIDKETGNCEMHLSWKEIWILIKNKKFIIPNEIFDTFLSVLIRIKADTIKNTDKDNL